MMTRSPLPTPKSRITAAHGHDQDQFRPALSRHWYQMTPQFKSARVKCLAIGRSNSIADRQPRSLSLLRIDQPDEALVPDLQPRSQPDGAAILISADIIDRENFSNQYRIKETYRS